MREMREIRTLIILSHFWILFSILSLFPLAFQRFVSSHRLCEQSCSKREKSWFIFWKKMEHPQFVNPCLKCCFECKCNMVHHKHTNVCPFRFCSVCAGVYCFRSMEICAFCGFYSASTDWAHVRSWTDTVDRRTGRVVHSTYDEQLAMQGLIHCILSCCIFPIMSLCFTGCAGLFWLISSPGHLCGDGLVPPEEGSDRCLSGSDFSDLFYNKPMCKPCNDCVYKPNPPAATPSTWIASSTRRDPRTSLSFKPRCRSYEGLRGLASPFSW